MNYLITGGAGFIGYHLSKFLSKNKKNKIYIVDNFARGKLDKDLKKLILKPNVNLIRSDIRFLNNKIKNKKIDYVYHFAAIVGVKNVVADPYNVLIQNLGNTIDILNIVRFKKKIKKFCFTSTSEVYANTIFKNKSKIPTPESIDLTIDKEIKPRSTYLLSKIAGEYLAHFSGLPYLIFRPHNIYGPRMGNSHVVPELINRMSKLNNNKILRIASPNHARSFCYIDLAVQMIYELSHNLKVKNKTFNIGTEKNEIKIFRLAKLISKKLRKKLILKKGISQVGSPSRRVPSMKEAKKYMKLKNISISDGLNKTIDWYRQKDF